MTLTVERAVYDSRTPVHPAWDGERLHQGIRLVVGREHAALAAQELLSRHSEIAIDIETCGTSPALARQIKVVTVGTPDLVIALDPRDDGQRPLIQKVLAHARKLVLHNASYDIPLLVGEGLADIDIVEKVECTLVKARLALPGRTQRKSLADLSERYLGLATGAIEDVFKAAGHRSKSEGYLHMDIDSPTYLTAAMLDTAMTARINRAVTEAAVAHLTEGHAYLAVGLDRVGALNEVERQQVVNRVMLRSTIRGFVLDEEYYEDYVDTQTRVMCDAAKVLEAEGLKPGSGSQLTQLLDSQGLLPDTWKRTPKTNQPSGDRKELARLRHPLVTAHLTYTEIDKNKKDYLDKLLDFARFDGRVHPQFKIMGADATGRMSAGDPPVQQFPNAARKMILADDDDGWVSIDWKAVEPMVSAFTSGQLDLAQAVLNGADTYVPVARAAGLIPADVSDFDAKEHKGRSAAKVVLLGLLYGKGVPLLAHELDTDYNTARDIKNQVLAGVPNINSWMEKLSTAANRFGTTMTAAGRIVSVDRDFNRGGFKGYQAQNYYHQGSAYDALADALVEIHRQGLAEHIRLAMHDELVVTTEAAEAVERIMRSSTVSLARLLTVSGLGQRVESLELPTDVHALPERWMKV